MFDIDVREMALRPGLVWGFDFADGAAAKVTHADLLHADQRVADLAEEFVLCAYRAVVLGSLVLVGLDALRQHLLGIELCQVPPVYKPASGIIQATSCAKLEAPR